MRVFITGASGFIGSYLLRHLVEDGHEIMAQKRATTDLWRVMDCANKVSWIEDGENFDAKLKCFAPEIIFNLAWNGVAAKERTDWTMQVSNIAMQQRLLNIAAECGTKKFVGVGSQAEYGAFENKIDETYPVQPNTAYGAAKNAGLVCLKTFCELHHIEWYWFRVFPCFGPTEAENWLIPSLIKNICTEEKMDLTPGEQKLAYLYVGEVARSIMSPIHSDDKSGVYNICSDNPIPLKELVTKIRNKINPEFTLNFGALPYRSGQCMYMEGNTTKLRTNLYAIDTTTFEDKLNETIEYYQQRYEQKRNI